ncbi:hypothetical protein [Prauserella muralis]|uniref:Uncharacterized protein n=1 Tax=Prauserella muralis TaxID=588067 RepID=A0A2V4BAK1_9PSEU|nr:hypothetical protein [Prauserella muralis]PXY32280.1 hypothetical protein BAY60_08350 [Prauserella muralis]TWE24048.1 hypothetical protein FHX69_5355 [Prauserella muralis]
MDDEFSCARPQWTNPEAGDDPWSLPVEPVSPWGRQARVVRMEAQRVYPVIPAPRMSPENDG